MWDKEKFLGLEMQLQEKGAIGESGSGGSAYGGGFRSSEFVASQRMDMREFLEELVGSQMFGKFTVTHM